MPQPKHLAPCADPGPPGEHGGGPVQGHRAADQAEPNSANQNAHTIVPQRRRLRAACDPAVEQIVDAAASVAATGVIGRG